MYSSNFISMGFGCCHCPYCRHVRKDKYGRRKTNKKSTYYGSLRPYQYKKIIKKLRQHKHDEELPNKLFNLMSYTD